MLNTFVKTFSRVSLALLLVSCSTDDPQHYIAEGKMLFDKGELESARVQFQNALQLDPKLADAYFQLALLDEKKQNWAGMLNNLMETITLDPKNLQSHLKLGQIYLVGGQLDKAAERARTALQLNQDDPTALLLQASVQFRQGQLDKAMQGAETVLSKQPFLPEAVGLQANILAADKKPAEAVAVLQAGIEHNPAHIDLRLLKIRLELDGEHFNQAVQDYQALVAQHPKDVDLWVSLVNLLSELGRLDEAENTLRKAIDHNPAVTELKLKLVNLLEQHHANQTEKTLQVFIGQLPDDTQLKFRLVDYYRKHQRLTDAGMLLQAIVKSDGNSADGLTAKIKLAEISLLQNDNETGESLAEQVLNIDPNNSEALLLRAGMRLNQQDADGVIADLRIVLRDRPNSERALLLQAQASLLKGETEVAESQWRKALEINPNNMAAIIALSDQLLKRGDYARAEELTLKAAKANPNDPSPLELLIQLKATQNDWTGAGKVVEQLKAIPHTALAAKYWPGFLAARQGRTQEAIKAYQDALVVQPNHTQTLVALIQLYESLGHRADLIAFLKEFTSKHPNIIQAQHLLADVYGADKNWEAAENTLIKASEHAPNDIELKLKRVDIIEQQNEARAEASLKALIQADPNQIRFKFRLASYYVDRQRYSDAVPVLQEIVGFDPASKAGLTAKLKLAELAWLQKDALKANTLLSEVIAKQSLRNEALLLRASQRMADNDTPAAIVDLQQVLENRPDNELALSMLAQAYQKSAGYNELIAFLQPLQEKHPDVAAVYPILATAYSMDKNGAAAEKLLQDKLKRTPKDTQAYVLLARVFAGQGKETDVEMIYQRGFTAIGNNLQLMVEQAKFYIAKQDFEKAINAYEKIVKQFPKNDEAANNLAVLLATHRADNKASTAHAMGLVERFKGSTNASVLDTYGWVHLKAGDVKNALPALQKASEGAPKDPAIHYHLAVAYRHQGNTQAAINELEKSLALAQQQGDFSEIEDAKALLKSCRSSPEYPLGQK